MQCWQLFFWGFCFQAPPIVDKYALMVTVSLTNGYNGANRCKSRLQNNSSALVFQHRGRVPHDSTTYLDSAMVFMLDHVLVAVASSRCGSWAQCSRGLFQPRAAPRNCRGSGFRVWWSGLCMHYRFPYPIFIPLTL